MPHYPNSIVLNKYDLNYSLSTANGEGRFATKTDVFNFVSLLSPSAVR